MEMKHWYDTDDLRREECEDPIGEAADSMIADLGIGFDEGICRDLELTDDEVDEVAVRIARAILPEGWTLTPPQ